MVNPMAIEDALVALDSAVDKLFVAVGLSGSELDNDGDIEAIKETIKRLEVLLP